MTTMMIVFATVQPIAVLSAGPVLSRFGVEPVLVAFATVQTVSMLAIALSALARSEELRPAAVEVETA